MRIGIAGLILGSAALLAQAPPTGEQDAYTRVELQPPQTNSFKVIHEVAATSAGATTFRWSPRWSRAQATAFKATDVMTGAPLKVLSITSATQTNAGDFESLSVTLARAVPKEGQARIRIELTANSAYMFRLDGSQAVFQMPLRAPRGTIVLPAGFELLSSNLPAQILSQPDGRIVVSYMHQMPPDATLALTMRAGVPTGAAAVPKALTNARSWEAAGQKPTERARLTERATQDRDIVYFLQEPSTNAFALYHDYTEVRPGTDKYINVVRTGSTVSNPSAYVLDTGEVLRHETLKGDAITAAKIDAGTVTPETEVVVIHFPPVKEGQSIRLRISETYTHPESYRLDGADLVFERNLGRARNSVVLPAGWYLTASSIPAVVRQTPEGLTRLDFVNGRPEGIDVFVKGRKR
jgi:hypothetical protein